MDKALRSVDPLEALKEEHEVIGRGLDVLELLGRVDPGRVPASDVDELLEFFDVFVDKCHHVKEEDALFPLAEERGIPREGSPIEVMLSEHEEGRGLRRSMLEASKNLSVNFNKFNYYARDFIYLLRQHIDKENVVLYPMINELLREDDRERLSKEFEGIEEKLGKDMHERYIRLIERLARDYATT